MRRNSAHLFRRAFAAYLLGFLQVHLVGNQEDWQSQALKLRPDLQAAQLGVAASQSQYQLAKANRARSLTTAWVVRGISFTPHPWRDKAGTGAPGSRPT